MTDFPSAQTPLPGPPRVPSESNEEMKVKRRSRIFYVSLVLVIAGVTAWLYFSNGHRSSPPGVSTAASVTVTATKKIACGSMQYADCSKVPIVKVREWKSITGGPSLKCEEGDVSFVKEGDRPVALDMCKCECKG